MSNSEEVPTSKHLRALRSKDYYEYMKTKSHQNKTDIADSITNALQKHLALVMLGNKKLPADRQQKYLSDDVFREFLDDLLSGYAETIEEEYRQSQVYVVEKKIERLKNETTGLKKGKKLDGLNKEITNLNKVHGRRIKEWHEIQSTFDDKRLLFAEMKARAGIKFVIAKYKELDKYSVVGQKYIEPLQQNFAFLSDVINEIKKSSEIGNKLLELDKLKKGSGSSIDS